MTLKKSMINKLEKHKDNYVLIKPFKTAILNLINSVPELLDYEVYNSNHIQATFYLIDMDLLKKIPMHLTCGIEYYYKVIIHGVASYDEIKKIIQSGIPVFDLSINQSYVKKNIEFKHVKYSNL